MSLAKQAMRFIILLGIVSLFADMTYEGARSITGAYLGAIGASAAAVAFIAGLGELIGYALRIVSGYFADKSGQYWKMTISGYCINLLAIPLLAFVNYWPIAAFLIIMERLGKAVRTPARDAMLSDAGETVGMGWGFGVHEALDQIGAMLGPLLIAVVLYLKGSYQHGFAILALPAILAIAVLVVARRQYPKPKDLAPIAARLQSQNFHRAFWLYLLAAGLVGAGFSDFSLIAYHFEQTAVLSKIWIPVAYALAMGSDALMSLVLGHFYDKRGILVLALTTLLSSFFGPMVFFGGPVFCVIGVILWGIGIGAQASLMRAIVGNMVSIHKRASAYGIFNLAFGICWFVGSVVMGLMYKQHLVGMVELIVLLQWAALPLFALLHFKLR